MTDDRSDFANVFAVVAHKGGVYKTSITSNVAGYLAGAGVSVLAVDLDTQGNLKLDLGLAGESDEGRALLHGLLSGKPVTPVPARPNLDVLMGGQALLEFDPADPLEALVPVLGPVVDDYDVIIIDTAPGQRDPGSKAALGVARHLIIPTHADQGSIDGIRMVVASISEARTVNPELGLLGVVLTGVQPQATTIHAEAKAQLAGLLGDPDLLFGQVIRHSPRAAKTQRDQGKTIRELLMDNPDRFVALKQGRTALGPSLTQLDGEYLRLTAEITERFNALNEDDDE